MDEDALTEYLHGNPAVVTTLDGLHQDHPNMQIVFWGVAALWSLIRGNDPDSMPPADLRTILVRPSPDEKARYVVHIDGRLENLNTPPFEWPF